MKCLKSNKTGNIIRVSEEQALQTAGREWSYVSKSEWRKETGASKATDQELHQKYPANVEGSKEFNRANKSTKKGK